MKKYILVLLALLFIPKTVFASPIRQTTVNYKVKVNNENGISFKSNDKEIKIPYNTVLDVNYEYELDGKLYGNIEYEYNIGDIELSETVLYDSKVNLNDYKSGETNKIYVISEGTYLYNGPSKMYGKVDGNIEIPVNTTLTYKYGDDVWVYVTYKNKTGWICIYTYDGIIYEQGAKIASVYDNKKLYTIKDIELVDSPFTNNKLDVTIPKQTYLDLKYSYSNSQNNTYFYVKYNNIEGWYYNKPLEVAQVYTDNFIVNAIEDNKIYKLPDINSEVLNEIKKDEEYSVIALSTYDNIDENSYESWSYISYKDIKGWIHSYEKSINENEKLNKEDNESDVKKNKRSYKINIVFVGSILVIIGFIMYCVLKIREIKN